MDNLRSTFGGSDPFSLRRRFPETRLRVEHVGDTIVVTRPRHLVVVVVFIVLTSLMIWEIRSIRMDSYDGPITEFEHTTWWERDTLDGVVVANKVSGRIYSRNAVQSGNLTALIIVGSLYLFLGSTIVGLMFPLRFVYSATTFEIYRWGIRRLSVKWGNIQAIEIAADRRPLIRMRAWLQTNYLLTIHTHSGKIRVSTARGQISVGDFHGLVFTLSAVALHYDATMTIIGDWKKDMIRRSNVVHKDNS